MVIKTLNLELDETKKVVAGTVALIGTRESMEMLGHSILRAARAARNTQTPGVYVDLRVSAGENGYDTAIEFGVLDVHAAGADASIRN